MSNINKNPGLNTYETKRVIIDYLFDKIDLSKYKYRFLSCQEDLEFLKKHTHYFSPNYS